MFNTSQSKVNAWSKCRAFYSFRYVDFLKPKVKPRPLKFGSIIHSMIEADIKGKNPFKVLSDIAKKERNLFEAEREMYGEIVQDVKYIMTGYFDYWDGKPEELEYLKIGKNSAEHLFEIEIAKGILAKGKIDASAKAKKLKWIVEHKSHKNFPKPEHRWRNLQSVLYGRIHEMMGWGKIDGTVWDYIRSKPPTRPAILKSGEMSRAALDSLPQVVEDIIKENKLDRKKYLEVITAQADNRSNWYQRIFTPTSKTIIEPILADFIATSQEMSRLHGKSRTKTFGRHCEWCTFEKLCAAQLQGHDVEYLMEKEFVKDEKDYHEDFVEITD